MSHKINRLIIYRNTITMFHSRADFQIINLAINNNVKNDQFIITGLNWVFVNKNKNNWKKNIKNILILKSV